MLLLTLYLGAPLLPLPGLVSLVSAHQSRSGGQAGRQRQHQFKFTGQKQARG